MHWSRQVLVEFGLYLSKEVEIRVEDSNQKHRFTVMPVRPYDIEIRDCRIGIRIAQGRCVTTNVITKTSPTINSVDH